MALPARTRLNLLRFDERINPVVSAYEIASVVDAATSPSLIGVVNIGSNPADMDCTGSLMADGRYILTAAHCVDSNGDLQADAETYYVRFDFAESQVLIPINKADIIVHPRWTGSVDNLGDVAVMRLPVLAPYGKTLGYELYTGRDELSHTLGFVGFGRIGTGTTGELQANNPRTTTSYLPEVQRLRMDGAGSVTLSFNGESKTLMAPVLVEDLQEALESFDDVNTVVVGRVNSPTNPNYGAYEIGFIRIDNEVPGFTDYDIPEITLTPGADFVGRVSVETLTDGTAAPLKRVGQAVIDRFDTIGGLGSGFPAENTASALGGGDSGGPAFLGNHIAGIASYGVGDTKFGDPTYWVRVSDYAESFLFPIFSQTKPVILDMVMQPEGNDGKADTVRLFSANFRLIVEVNGEQYYNGPLSRISAITIRAATDPLAIISTGNFGVPLTFSGTTNIQQTAYPWAAVGSASGESSTVKIVNLTTSAVAQTLTPFESSFTGGVSVAMGDVTGDGVPDTIVGAGPGGGPAIHVFDGATGERIQSFFAFEETFTGGVSVAVGDLNADGIPEIIVGAGPGGGPHIRAFDVRTQTLVRNYFAFEESFTGGVTVAVGDLDGDGTGDVIVGAGPGGGPHVRVFSGLSRNVIRSFFAFDESFTGGVRVASGNLAGNPVDDIIVGAGPGGGPQVRTFDGQTGDPVLSVYAFDSSFTGGVFVAGGQPAGRSSVVLAGAGHGGTSQVPVFDGHTGEQTQTLDLFEPTFLGGVAVGLANDPGGTPTIDPVPLPTP